VEVVGRKGFRYREGSRQMFVDSYVLTGPSEVTVYKQTRRKWDPPYENLPIKIQIATEFSTTFSIPFAAKLARLI
jgi:hypothetical protein